jgi:hypothetical protein
MGRGRAGTLAAAVVIALAFPAVALGQLEPVGEAVDKAGPSITEQVPEIQVPASVEDVTGSAKPAGGGASASTGSSAPRTAAASRASKAAPARGSRAHTASARNARAASSGHSVSGARALGQDTEEVAAASAAQASSFTESGTPAAAENSDSRLPFTGGYALPFLALGAGLLLAGWTLRTSPRLRIGLRK